MWKSEFASYFEQAIVENSTKVYAVEVISGNYPNVPIMESLYNKIICRGFSLINIMDTYFNR